MFFTRSKHNSYLESGLSVSKTYAIYAVLDGKCPVGTKR